MATEFDLTALFPQPQHVEFLEGTTEMCSDVRLATSNVLPFMRKTMRTVFTGANIRIVANKKKFVIHVNIVDKSELDFAAAPPELRNDFYRMTVQDNVVTIQAASQLGAVWGTQTFANLYKATGHEVSVPNMEIADWAAFPMRGLFIPADDIAAEMHLDEWCSLLDRLGEAKLNMLAIELLGNENLEHLLVHLNDDEEWTPATERTYYSPVEQDWKSEPFAPVMFSDDCYGDYVTAASERGIQLVPALSLFVNNSLLTQLSPALAGKDAAGNERADICCFMSSRAREQIETFYGYFLDTYYPDGADKLLLQFDRLPAAADTEQWCQCEACQDRAPQENVASLALWLVTLLTAKGVNQVILRNTSQQHQFSVLTPELVKQLDTAGLADRVILQPAVNVAKGHHAVIFGEFSGTVGSWLALGNSFCDCLASCADEQAAAVTVRRAQEIGTLGVVNAASADPFGRETDRVAGAAQWNTVSLDTVEPAVKAVLASLYGPYADDYLCAWQTLSSTAKASSILQACCVCGLESPTAKVTSALKRVAHFEDADARLEQVATAAQTTIEHLQELATEKDKEEKSIRTADLIAALSLLGEATRTKAVANLFRTLLPFSDELCNGALPAKAKGVIEQARDALVQAMQETAEYKPRYVLPAALMHLSVLLAFLDDIGE